MKNEQPLACKIEAPCKINLHLSVGEKRPDGFHNLESLFASLAFGDTLRFERTKKGDCHLFMEWEIPEEKIAQEKNLVFKAVSLFRERSGFDSSLDIRVQKRIPSGAGLGGGSSDAASTLLALNYLAGNPIGSGELGEMAALLGSDVPFFLTGGAAFVSGRGEIVEELRIPGKLWVVLAKPPFSSNTAGAFKLLDEARHATVFEKGRIIPGERPFPNPPREVSFSASQIRQVLKGEPETWPFRNDFLPVFCNMSSLGDGENLQKAAAYRSIFEVFKVCGASFSGLSGSGSCCFGLFKRKKTAKNAEKALSKMGNFSKLTFFLARRPDPVL